MPQPSQEGSPFTIPTAFLLLAAAVVGWYRYQPPLKSQRPQGSESRPESIGEQQAPARLWQDPLQAIDDYQREILPRSPEAQAILTASANARFAMFTEHLSKAHKTMRVLCVMVEGGPYPDKVEWRRRARYAVVSALSVCGYGPADGEHIACVRDENWPEKVDDSVVRQVLQGGPAPETPAPLQQAIAGSLWAAVGQAQAHKPAYANAAIPYEWFKRDTLSPGWTDKNKNDEVLVLWADDNLFSRAPITRMVLMFQHLFKGGMALTDIPISIIGPDSSNTLQDMLEDPLVSPPAVAGMASLYNPDPPAPGTPASKRVTPASTAGSAAALALQPPGVREILHQIQWFAARPTAPSALLTSQCSHVVPNGDATASPDGLVWLTAAAFEEGRLLSDPNACADPRTSLMRVTRTNVTDDQLIASLIGELGRRGVDLADPRTHVALVSEFDTFYGRALPDIFEKQVSALRGQNRTRETIHRYSYLRGLDGITGAEARAEARKARTPNDAGARGQAADATVDSPPSEELPDGNRQFDYMRRIAGELKATEQSIWSDNHSAVLAIGILGSDVYDKLLVMRALRHEFPRAIFFTTDLYNNLFQKQELETTRNLIVASGYGLKLRPDYQQFIPPFRDSYQTAVFASCIRAIGTPEMSKGIANAPPATPRLFEIGRNGAYDLSLPEHGINPEPPQLAPISWTIVFTVGGLVVLTFLLLPPLSPYLWRLLPKVKLPRFLTRKSASSMGPAEKAVGPSAPGASNTANLLYKNESTEARNLKIATFIFAVLFAALFLIARYDAGRGDGKPFYFASGVSLWPTEGLRLLAVFLSAVFLIKSYHGLYKNSLVLESHYCHGNRRSRASSKSAQGAWDWRGWLRLRRDRTIWAWEGECDRFAEGALIAPPGPSKPRVKVTGLWKEYIDRGTCASRLWRVIPLCVLFILVGMLATLLYGSAFRPYRGQLSSIVDISILWLSILSMVFLTFFVVDAIRLCNVFCENLAGKDTPWDKKIAKSFADSRRMDAADIPEWLDVQLIADRTAAVGKLIFYPFIVLAVVIASRNVLFDRWEWPLPLIVIFGILCCYAIWCVILLRRSAEQARQDLIAQLNERLIRLKHTGGPSVKGRMAQIELTMEEIRSIRRGAFAPLSQHPLIGAVLIPASGTGALWLIQCFTSQQ